MGLLAVFHEDDAGSGCWWQLNSATCAWEDVSAREPQPRAGSRDNFYIWPSYCQAYIGNAKSRAEAVSRI